MSKLRKKKADSRVKDRADRHDRVMERVSVDQRKGYRAPGSRNVKKTGR